MKFATRNILLICLFFLYFSFGKMNNTRLNKSTNNMSYNLTNKTKVLSSNEAENNIKDQTKVKTKEIQEKLNILYERKKKYSDIFEKELKQLNSNFNKSSHSLVSLKSIISNNQSIYNSLDKIKSLADIHHKYSNNLNKQLQSIKNLVTDYIYNNVQLNDKKKSLISNIIKETDSLEKGILQNYLTSFEKNDKISKLDANSLNISEIDRKGLELKSKITSLKKEREDLEKTIDRNKADFEIEYNKILNLISLKVKEEKNILKELDYENDSKLYNNVKEEILKIEKYIKDIKNNINFYNKPINSTPDLNSNNEDEKTYISLLQNLSSLSSEEENLKKLLENTLGHLIRKKNRIKSNISKNEDKFESLIKDINKEETLLNNELELYKSTEIINAHSIKLNSLLSDLQNANTEYNSLFNSKDSKEKNDDNISFLEKSHLNKSFDRNINKVLEVRSNILSQHKKLTSETLKQLNFLNDDQLSFLESNNKLVKNNYNLTQKLLKEKDILEGDYQSLKSNYNQLDKENKSNILKTANTIKSLTDSLKIDEKIMKEMNLDIINLSKSSKDNRNFISALVKKLELTKEEDKRYFTRFINIIVAENEALKNKVKNDKIIIETLNKLDDLKNEKLSNIKNNFYSLLKKKEEEDRKIEDYSNLLEKEKKKVILEKNLNKDLADTFKKEFAKESELITELTSKYKAKLRKEKEKTEKLKLELDSEKHEELIFVEKIKSMNSKVNSLSNKESTLVKENNMYSSKLKEEYQKSKELENKIACELKEKNEIKKLLKENTKSYNKKEKLLSKRIKRENEVNRKLKEKIRESDKETKELAQKMKREGELKAKLQEKLDAQEKENKELDKRIKELTEGNLINKSFIDKYKNQLNQLITGKIVLNKRTRNVNNNQSITADYAKKNKSELSKRRR